MNTKNKISLTGDVLEFNNKKTNVGFYSLVYDALKYLINNQKTQLTDILATLKVSGYKDDELIANIISIMGGNVNEYINSLDDAMLNDKKRRTE
jgi:hypothetical protein